MNKYHYFSVLCFHGFASIDSQHRASDLIRSDSGVICIAVLKLPQSNSML